MSVGPNTVTTWYAAVAIPSHSIDVRENIWNRLRVHFLYLSCLLLLKRTGKRKYKILFPVSYGLSREALEHVNYDTKFNGRVPYEFYVQIFVSLFPYTSNLILITTLFI